MNLPATAAGALVLFLGLLPGLPGDTIYRRIAGVSWRQKDIWQAARIFSFSLVGLSCYSILADWGGWYQPAYIIPQTFIMPGFSSAQLPMLGAAYLGHFVLATVVGALVAGGARLVALTSPYGNYRDAWDQFVNFSVAGRWILVTLTSGETYAGILEHADISVEPEYRDLILSEPYRYDKEESRFVPTYNQFVFIRGVDLGSLSAVYDEGKDAAKRVSAVSIDPFAGG